MYSYTALCVLSAYTLVILTVLHMLLCVGTVEKVTVQYSVLSNAGSPHNEHVSLVSFPFNRREFYRQQGVPVQFTPFSKECSLLWKGMNDDDKLKFQKMAEEDRERYRREVSGLDKPLAKDGTRRGRRKKEPGQPKRNM